ncbi:hypothetical protein LY76DRAFT_87803 [Colletotrichum caudatum]|nr:hypothetical protein LY76DRAFT_87803 [Colletotrichum caudatum]
MDTGRIPAIHAAIALLLAKWTLPRHTAMPFPRLMDCNIRIPTPRTAGRDHWSHRRQYLYVGHRERLWLRRRRRKNGYARMGHLIASNPVVSRPCETGAECVGVWTDFRQNLI